MKNQPILFSFLFWIALCLGVSCSNNPPMKVAPQNESSLLGSWEMVSIFWITKDTTYAIEKSQPGLLLITPERYSIMWTPTEKPRIPFANLSQPTDEELKAGFRSIVFNGGSYSATDSTLTTQAQVAKVPGFAGGKQFYRYQIKGNELVLTMFDETYPDGTKPDWFGKYETKFVLRKIN